MDKIILNGSKLRVYDSGNNQSGSIQYTDSKLSIGNSAGSGVLITDGKLYLKSGATTTSIIYDAASSGVTIADGLIHLGTGSNTSSIYNDNGNVHIDSGITVSNLNIEYTEGVAANIQGRVQFGRGLATGNYSHAEGYGTRASGDYSHAQGYDAITSGDYSHAQGQSTEATGYSSHAQGYGAIASGHYSHAEGYGTTTSIDNQHASGKYNAVDNNAIFIVGVGSSAARENGFWVTLTGQANAGLGFSSSGYLKIGGDITSSGAKIGSGTGYVSSSAGVYSTKGGSDVMNDLGAYRTITINGTSNEVSVSLIGAQNLGANRTWTIGLPDNVKITNNLTIGDNVVSDVFSSGFGGSGFAISQSNNRYIAQFDDLWVRGSMNVYEMVINQIRSTNGSLWISDASKATSASYSSATNTLILSFQTGSLVPFIAGDILRSKRWGLSGSTTQSQWDITTTVSAVNYATGYVTLSAPTINNLYTVTGSANGTWIQLAERLSNSGSQWVRVGNIGSNLDRRGSIYITSTDLGGPFLDVYDLVTNSVQATGGISGSVRQSKTKVRLGQLSGIVDSNFGGELSGYGLYADNVYLRGTISATAGTFSGKVTANQGSIGGWSIGQNTLTQEGSIVLGSSSIVGADDIFIGSEDGSPYFQLGSKFKYTNSNIVMSGSISSSAGQIGGWSLGSSELSSSGIVLNSFNPSIVLGGFNPLAMSDRNGVALWKNFSGQYSFFVGKMGHSPVNSDAYLQWDGSNLLISSQFFNLNSGRMTASGGQIGQWTISQNAVSANGVTLSSGTNPYIGIGTATHNGTGIFLGKSNNASMSIWSANNRGLTWNGSALIISGSNFTLSSEGSISASNAVLGGTIYANSGKIGDTNGWAIGTGKLSSANSQIFLTSSATYPSLRIYTTSVLSGYNSGYKNYIYLGLYSSVPKFQLIGNTNYFKWDSTKSTIKADNFELNESGTIIANNAIISGSISSSAGSIGGWNINFSGITATHPTGIISVTKQGSTILQLLDQNGNFLYSANNASLFNSIIDYYQKKQNYSKLTVYTGVSTSIATGEETWSGVGYNVQQQGVSFYNLFTYTVSGLTPNKQYILQLNMHNFKVDGGVGYQGSRQNYKSPSFIWAWISDLAGATPVQESVGGQYVMNPLFNLGEQGIKQFKFTATAQEMYIKSMYTLRHLDNNVHTTSFTFSGFRIDEFQHFTELSDKGLIVFNNPSNYLQLSSCDNIDNASNGAIDSFNINKLNVNQVHIQDPKYRNAPVFVDVYTESLSSNLNISSSLLLSMGGFNTDQVNVSVPVQVQVYRLTDTTVWTQVTDYPVRLKSLDNINLLSRIEIDLPESSGTYSVATTFRVV